MASFAFFAAEEKVGLSDLKISKVNRVEREREGKRGSLGRRLEATDRRKRDTRGDRDDDGLELNRGTPRD